MAELALQIAGFTIGLVNRSELPLVLEDGYTDFVPVDYSKPFDVSVNVHQGIPANLKSLSSPIYEAVFEGNVLWKIFLAENQRLLFHVFSPERPNGLQQVAELDADRTTWTVYLEATKQNGLLGLVPLNYPLGPLIMYYLTVRFDAVMIHSSCVTENGDAHLFTGVSGKGKSTMARLWFENGAEVLNDDRLIIRKENEKYVVHNTPMFYQDRPRRAFLKNASIIHHAEKNNSVELTGAEAVSQLAANIIQHGYDGNAIAHHLDFLAAMVKKVNVFSLGFLPDHSIIEYLKTNEPAAFASI